MVTPKMAPLTSGNPVNSSKAELPDGHQLLGVPAEEELEQRDLADSFCPAFVL